jgi:hypothetical protein
MEPAHDSYNKLTRQEILIDQEMFARHKKPERVSPKRCCSSPTSSETLANQKEKTNWKI